MAAYIDQFLHHAMGRRASDVHFSSGEPVRLRIDGDLVPMDNNALSSEQIEQIFMEILTEEEKVKFEKNKNLDKSYSVEGLANFRFNIFWTRRGMAAVIRSIPSKIPTMQDLGLPEAIQGLTELAKGLVLVTGPTGSGKSTTLAAMLNHINQTQPYHILTVEDPVEFVHPSKRSLVNQREIGTNCHSFSDALKYALREDPDVILVGEMRDLETIGLALTAAETGHLVFGTLHTRGAAASVDRIIDSFPANQQNMVRAMLAESLMGVISQALLKRKGTPGRVAAYEIMITNHAISNLIREGKTFQITSVIQTGRREGMILMESHIKELIAAGIVDEHEAAPYLPDDGSHAKSKPTGPPKPMTPPPPPPPAPAATAALNVPAPKPFVPKPLKAPAKKGVETATRPAPPPLKPAAAVAKPAPIKPSTPLGGATKPATAAAPPRPAAPPAAAATVKPLTPPPAPAVAAATDTASAPTEPDVESDLSGYVGIETGAIPLPVENDPNLVEIVVPEEGIKEMTDITAPAPEPAKKPQAPASPAASKPVITRTPYKKAG